MVDFYQIGQRIYEERKRLNMSRDKLAEHLGLSVYYIGQLERGARKMSFDTLIRLSDCLHVSLDYLIWGKTEHVINRNDLDELLAKCSQKEISMIVEVIKSILPYTKGL